LRVRKCWAASATADLSCSNLVLLFWLDYLQQYDPNIRLNSLIWVALQNKFNDSFYLSNNRTHTHSPSFALTPSSRSAAPFPVRTLPCSPLLMLVWLLSPLMPQLREFHVVAPAGVVLQCTGSQGRRCRGRQGVAEEAVGGKIQRRGAPSNMAWVLSVPARNPSRQA
jgi:hypothetical protein